VTFGFEPVINQRFDNHDQNGGSLEFSTDFVSLAMDPTTRIMLTYLFDVLFSTRREKTEDHRQGRAVSAISHGTLSSAFGVLLPYHLVFRCSRTDYYTSHD